MSIKRNTKNQMLFSTAAKYLLMQVLCLSFCVLGTSVVCFGQSYGMERDFPKQVVLPNAVYQILLKDEDINDELKQARTNGQSVRSIKKQYFQATKTNINDDNLPDLIVKGQSYLLGANTTHFWVFKNLKGKYTLVFETAAHDVAILKSKHHGYRNIRSISLSVDTVYIGYSRYDGKEYIFSWNKTEEIK